MLIYKHHSRCHEEYNHKNLNCAEEAIASVNKPGIIIPFLKTEDFFRVTGGQQATRSHY